LNRFVVVVEAVDEDHREAQQRQHEPWAHHVARAARWGTTLDVARGFRCHGDGIGPIHDDAEEQEHHGEIYTLARDGDEQCHVEQPGEAHR
jgi:hypothetical protein